MHPGWVDTPGIHESLPDFARLMGPLLRTPEQGADTMVWLATAREPLSGNGQFWLDRHRRWTSKLPWTRTSAADADHLWELVSRRAGVDAVARPRAGGHPLTAPRSVLIRHPCSASGRRIGPPTLPWIFSAKYAPGR